MKSLVRLLLVGTALWACGDIASATPIFARAYGAKCSMCHSGFPRLNAFGLAFKANNFRLPGADEATPFVWRKTIPLAAQTLPTRLYGSPGGKRTDFTDTQILVSGFIAPKTSIFMHHSYFVDAYPIDFPSYELWLQTVLDDSQKIMLKAGQYELPFGYSPGITKTTVTSPLAFGSSFFGNDVFLSNAVTGAQLSGLAAKSLRWYFSVSAPAHNAAGKLNSEKQFFGRFRDVFVRLANQDLNRSVSGFLYLVDPTRNRNDPATGSYGRRFGVEGNWIEKDFQVHAMALYAESTSPTGTGQRGSLRGAFLEADAMLAPWLGVTARVDVRTRRNPNGPQYRDAKTISLRAYPLPNIRLVAEFQDLDHGRTNRNYLAAFTF